ncbi:MAG: DinB family protein [Bacteroidota bacterium]
MYRVINDFLEDWKYESESTIKLFNNITEEKKEQKVTPDGRSLSYLAWHITNSIPDMMTKTGLDFGRLDEQEREPEKFENIISTFQKNSDTLYEQIKNKWTDNMLAEELNLWGENWAKGKLLKVLIIHQVHHRAQMTVLMRQAGLKVPGVYGPSKEEWAAMGMEPQK